MIIEFLTTKYNWSEGYETEILEDDEDYYYFEDEEHLYTSIDKYLEDSEFIIK
jgi:hypothetical protein